MGTVYKAEDTRLGRSVAIKILNPSLDTGPKELERFQSEAKVQARLNHPNIVTLHEFEPYGDSYCMIMEYVEGRTLAEIIRQVGSPRMKLLFDIYHVQIMDGDIIQRIHQYKDYIGHYHTAGNPGRASP